MWSPPRQHSLLLLDHHSLTILLHPIANGAGVALVFQQELLFFKSRNDFGAAIKRWVCANRR